MRTEGVEAARRAAAASPWPLLDLLRILTDGVQHLLTVHDCDCHGYERLQAAVEAARARVSAEDGK